MHRLASILLISSVFLLSTARAFPDILFSPSSVPAVLPQADKNIAALQQALPFYQYAITHPWPIVPKNGKIIKSGDKGYNPLTLLALRERLKATGEWEDTDYSTNPPSNNLMSDDDDPRLVKAVMQFQLSHGLTPDGVVGAETLRELNIPPATRLQQLQINLSRWEKLKQSNQLGKRYIFVNIPAYQLDVVEDNKIILHMKAIIGKPTRPTPEIRSMVTRIVFNPYWNVPKLIAQKDIIPKFLNDPQYLDDMQIKIIHRDEDNNNSSLINPQDVDWQTAETNGLDSFQYYFRQNPGENNALGLVKFEFQNSYDVYMHDTPAKELFSAEKRAFSSGCIRLEKPLDLVGYLMQTSTDWNNERMEMILDEGKTRTIKAAHPTPLIITYLTVFVDENNKLQFRNDIYGQDSNHM